MTATPKAMARTTLTAASATLYTVPAATTAIVTNILLANTSSSPVSVTLLFDSVALIPTVSVPGNSVVPFDLRQVLATTKVITGYASTASAVTCHVSGSEVT